LKLRAVMADRLRNDVGSTLENAKFFTHSHSAVEVKCFVPELNVNVVTPRHFGMKFTSVSAVKFRLFAQSCCA